MSEGVIGSNASVSLAGQSKAFNDLYELGGEARS